jgi:hypothetical protein
MEEGVYNLARGIVLFAIEDWRNLIKAKAYRNRPSKTKIRYSIVSFNELRAFFQSGWFDWLLDGCGVGVSGDYILRMLENELEEATTKDKAKNPKRTEQTGTGKYMCLEDGFVCSSGTEAAKHSHVCRQRFFQVLDNANKTAKGHHWVRVRKDD